MVFCAPRLAVRMWLCSFHFPLLPPLTIMLQYLNFYLGVLLFFAWVSMLVLTGIWDPSQIGSHLLFNAASCCLTTQSQSSSAFETRGADWGKCLRVGVETGITWTCSGSVLSPGWTLGLSGKLVKLRRLRSYPKPVRSLENGIQVVAKVWNQL